MIPEKGKKYNIKYNDPKCGYCGEGTCVDVPADGKGEDFAFNLPGYQGISYFRSEDIVSEVNEKNTLKMRMEYIMPCPFCGGTELTYKSSSPNHSLGGLDVSIVCDICLATGPSRRMTETEFDDNLAGLPRKVLERWNKRADVRPLSNQV